MRHFLATSNHGNHTGFNRKWKVEEIDISKGNPLIDIALKVSDNYSYIDSKYFEEYPEVLDDGELPQWYDGEGVYDDNSNLEVLTTATSYEHDLVYYLLITYNGIDLYRDNNGHYAGLYNKLCEAADIEI